MKKVKIAFIISNLSQGGAERQFSYLINQLDISRYEITLFLYASQKAPFYKDVENNEKIILFKKYLKSRFSILKIFEAILGIRSFLVKNQYDIVVTTLFMNNFLVRLSAPKSYKNKIICNVRTSIKMYTKFHVLCERCQIKNSVLVFNSHKTKNEFVRLFKGNYLNKMFIVYNGFIGTDNFYVNNSKYTFGCLGRLSKEKNLLQVIEVFSESRQLNLDSNLIIQGHFGNQYEEIVALGSIENVEIREANPDVEIFFSSINTLVLPSLFEGCPNVLFEALLRKKLCIVSKNANTDDFIVDGLNGFVYDGTDKGLQAAMYNAAIISGTPTEKLIIENGYNYAQKNFSMPVMVDKYEELFKMIYEDDKSCNKPKNYTTLQTACF